MEFLEQKPPSSTSTKTRRSKRSREPEPNGEPMTIDEQNKLKRIRSRLRTFTAKKRIQTFMKNTKPQRQSAFLKAICSDAGICIGFGKENKKIYEFFDEFSLKYAIPEFTKIGSTSANGFVREVEFEKLGYKTHGILKSSSKQLSDNLFYEYIVGKYFINEQKKFFPCFLETYGLYKYANPKAYLDLKSNIKKVKIPGKIEEKLIPIKGFNTGLKQSCVNPKHVCILIEHIKYATEFYDYLESYSYMNSDIVSSLFQVYAPLSHLRNNYTHYDLHNGNVMLFKPFNDGYITMHYHFSPTDIVTFHTQHIAKIIDYGRSFFKDPVLPNQNSEDFYNHLCKMKECNNEHDPTAPCGDDYGYNFFDPNDIQFDILSTKRNMSHDLRLLVLCEGYTSILDQIVSNTPYGKFSTPENENDGFDTSLGINSPINNVNDAYNVLKHIINNTLAGTTYDFTDENTKRHAAFKKMGDLHVYFDGKTQMKYEPIK